MLNRLRRHARNVGSALAVLLALSGCGAAATPDPDAIAGKFDVGGRSLYLECHGTGSPTVVLDAGLGNSHTTWAAVAPAVAKSKRTCTYDRANIGASDPAAKPRSSAAVVADLRALLKAAKIEPPYVLVGHSFGGLDMRLFAASDPSEVTGLVLVDPTPTDFVDGECRIVDATLCSTLRAGWDASKNPDGLDIVQSAQDIAAAGALPAIPLTVLAATVHKQDAIKDPGVETQIEALWQQAQATLASTVPGATLTVVASGHDIQTLHPDAVITAIDAVLARAGATS